MQHDVVMSRLAKILLIPDYQVFLAGDPDMSLGRLQVVFALL